jgi:hypothetical protein
MLTIMDYKLRTKRRVEKHKQRHRHTDTMRCGLSWASFLVVLKLRNQLPKRILLRNEDEFYDPEIDVNSHSKQLQSPELHSATTSVSRIFKNNLISTVRDPIGFRSSVNKTLVFWGVITRC